MNQLWTAIAMLVCLIPFYIGIGFHLIQSTQHCSENSECSVREICSDHHCVYGCDDNECGTNAYCQFHNGSLSCQCKPHYSGDPMQKCLKPRTTTPATPSTTRKPDIPLPTPIQSPNVTIKPEISSPRTTEPIPETNSDGNYAISPHAATVTLLMMALGAANDTKRKLSAALNLKPSDLTQPLDMERPTAVGIKSLINTFIPNDVMRHEPIRINPACKITDKFNKTIMDLDLGVTNRGAWNAGDPTVVFPSAVTFSPPVTEFSLNCWRRYPKWIRIVGKARRGTLPSLDGAEFFELPYTGPDRGLNNASLIFIIPSQENLMDIESVKRKFSRLNYGDFANYQIEMFALSIDTTTLYKKYNFSSVYPPGIISNAEISPEGNFNGDFHDLCNVNQDGMSYTVSYTQDYLFGPLVTGTKDCREDGTDGGQIQTYWWQFYITLLVSNKSILTFVLHLK